MVFKKQSPEQAVFWSRKKRPLSALRKWPHKTWNFWRNLLFFFQGRNNLHLQNMLKLGFEFFIPAGSGPIQCKICKNIDTYSESKGRFYTWILTIERNTSIDKLRSKNFNNTQKNLSSDNFVNLLDDSRKLINKIDSTGIQEFVKKLKPKCIEIIDLLFFKGYTQQEASEELAMPLGTIKTRNKNCINDLRNYLKI